MRHICAFVVCVTISAACASGGSRGASAAGVEQASASPARARRTSANCPPKIDSVFLVHGPVFRGCDVDAQARIVGTPPRPDFQLSARDGCISAYVEFVVGADGVPENETVRVVRTNNQSFAQAVEAVVPELRYTPAKRDGVAVRQLIQWGVSIQIAGGLAGAGAPAMGPPRC